MRLIDYRKMQCRTGALLRSGSTVDAPHTRRSRSGRNYLKRAASNSGMSLSKADRFADTPDVDLVALDDALKTLEEMNEQQSRV
jgi:hypothetical protein